MGYGLINEVKAWITDKFLGDDRQSLWTRIAGGTLDEDQKVVVWDGTNPIVVTDGQLQTSGTTKPSGLNVGGIVTEVTLSDSSWVALPGTAQTDRNAIAIQNYSGSEVKINFDNGQVGYVGIILQDGAERQYDITDNIIIYGKAASGTSPVLYIEEIS